MTLRYAVLVEVGVAGVHELQHLAFGDRVGGLGEDLEHAHALDADHHLERARIQEIADQHRRRVAELRVGGGMAAPQCGLVDDVVVQQRGGVDHLDHRRQRVLLGARDSRVAPRGQQQQRRAQALAAAADDVLGDLADQNDVGGEATRAGRGRPPPCRRR